MLFRTLLMLSASIALMITMGCSGLLDDEPPPPKPQEYLTLADLAGRITLREDSPDVRVIRVKAKGFIKQNDIRSAKSKALELAKKYAVDAMVRELMPTDLYNNNFAQIEDYLSKNLQNYVDSTEVTDEKRIFAG